MEQVYLRQYKNSDLILSSYIYGLWRQTLLHCLQ